MKVNKEMLKIHDKKKLTGKKPAGAIGPPGIPSFGGICPNGLGAVGF